jgi:GT2 family glycosyltransferase
MEGFLSLMSGVELSIIIVNWNSVDYVLECARTIREQTPLLRYEVIVVDNASHDRCAERLDREYPDVTYVQNARNSGFGAANNLGGWKAQGAVLLFLNPDTEVQDRAIERLYWRFQKLTDPGAVGCRLLNTDGSLQTSCVQALPSVLNQVLDAEVLRRWFPNAGLWGTARLLQNGEEPVEVEAVSGACLMMSREVFRCVGGFGSEYFMYGEDLDLCLKARQAGFRNYHVGEAVVVHHGGGSSQETRSDFSIVMMRESVSRLLRKSRGGFYSGCYRLAMMGAAIVRLILLGVLFPVWVAARRMQKWHEALKKWFAVLRWGFGLERWTKRYDYARTEAAHTERLETKSCAGSAEN